MIERIEDSGIRLIEISTMNIFAIFNWLAVNDIR